MIALFFLTDTPAFSQKFACDGRFFVSITDQEAQQTQIVTTDSEEGVVTFTPVVPFKDFRFNGMGYNAADNFIYAISRENRDIIRLFSDNTYEVVGSRNGALSWEFSAADCSPDGFFVVNHRRTSELIYLNVLGVPEQNDFSLHAKTELQWDPASGNTGKVTLEIDDLVFDPQNPTTIYTFQRNRLSYPYLEDPNLEEPENTRGTLLKIDGDPDSPTFGRVSAVGNGIDESLARTIGAFFFDASGNLYGYASAVTNPIQLDRLIAIDKNTGTARLVGEGPRAVGADGCSCPYTLMLQMQPTAQEVKCGELLDYEITVINSFARSINEVEYHHTLPEGTILQSVVGAPGEVKEGTGEGFNSLILEGISLPAGAEISFTVQVRAGSEPGSYYHQAELRNVPSELGSTLRSDDTATDIPGDPTLMVIQQRDWPTSEVDILAGGPCTDQTSTLRIANEQFESDFPYYVSYQQDGATIEAQEIYTDATGNLLLPNLEAGTYNEITISTATTNGCELTLEGSWTVQPPPSPQAFNLSSNAPVCEAEELQLTANTEGEAFYWTGPNNFYSEERDPVIEEVSSEQSGFYYFHKTVEGCELVDSLEVTIHTLPSFSLGPDTTMRHGGQIQLMPDVTYPAGTSYQWSPPQDISCTDCAMPWVSPAEDTEYELQVTSSEGCIQSDRISVEVLKTTVVSIPNAFTPNGDGLNDIFYPTGDAETMTVTRMAVYNRWGELIFRRDNFPANTEAHGWPGTYQGKRVGAGSYLYQIEVKLSSGEQRSYQGKVQLLP
uniref:Gliding motility-associated C-terminal domain-containing protein n=1 Tax=Roseihalotalea indica TaxID=2867963 RepID=A0AA49GT04_9BACT|nr:gliding motility-associated C-terminal domain-containing protein [Tunicatimonas sp. TK19036]